MIETLNGTHETVNYRENTNLRIYDNTQFEEYPTHWHSPAEIIMPVRGTYTLEYNDEAVTLREEDIIILCPGVLHHLLACEGERYILQAEIHDAPGFGDINSIITMIYPALIITPETFPDTHHAMTQLVRSALKEYREGAPFFEASVYSMLTEMLVLAGRGYTENSERFITTDFARQKKYMVKFMTVCEYIDRHCTENLTLDMAAAYSGFSKYHFTRLFRQFTGTTFYRYMNQKRIARAQSALADPSLSITDVAMASGFSSMSAFVRMFKIIKGCTPSEFRRLYQPNLERDEAKSRKET